MPTTHTFPQSRIYDVFDNSVAPVLTVAPGDTVTFECPGPPLPEHATPADIEGLEHDRPHRLVGPVAVEGAEPGDTLVVEIVSVEVSRDFGHTFVVPGYALLGDEFTSFYVQNFDLRNREWTELRPGVRIPIEPFCGIMGLAPAEPGEHSTLPPRAGGGNLDVRHLTSGSTLRLPVQVAGAQFWCGDGHAAQGDGEVCLTGIETSVTATFRFGLDKGRSIPAAQLTVPGPLSRPGDERGYFAVTAPGPDLYESTRTAIRTMIDHLVEERGLTREEAYVLCSLAVDLKISEIVNAPNWTVSAYLPLGLFD